MGRGIDARFRDEPNRTGTTTAAPDRAVPVDTAVAGLLPNAPEVRLETAPGGHLGVLTGRSAKRTTWRHLDEFFAAHQGGALGLAAWMISVTSNTAATSAAARASSRG